jgi:predicted RecA/RadA family phage recombinase
MSAGDLNNDNGTASVTVPTGGYTKGQIYLINDAYVVALETKAAAATCLVAHRANAVEVVKATGTGKSFAFGDKLYAKSNKAEPATSTGAVLMNAVALETAATSATTVKVAWLGGIGPAAT